MFGSSVLLSAFASTALAGSILWDGRFNDMTSSTDLEKWSFANPVGAYQYYIHGSGAVTDYVNLDASFKNPADTASKQGAKITIDSTAKWNSDMLRTELIPQTKAAINSGKVWYHFSMKRSDTNAPSVNHEHQVNFFESHFTEMKYGWISGQAGEANASLQWFVGGSSKWSIDFDADVWHNVAYEIDFSASTVSFHHSTGSDDLALTAGPFSASTSSNGADWHLGVLRLPRSGYDSTAAEDWYFSGVYVESESLTTSVGNGGSSSGEPVASSAVVAKPSSTPAAVASSKAPSSSAAAVVSTPASTPAAISTPAVVSTPAASSVVVAPSSSTPVVEVVSTSAVSSPTPISIAPSTLETLIRTSTPASSAPAVITTPVEEATPSATSTAASGPTTKLINGEWWVCN